MSEDLLSAEEMEAMCGHFVEREHCVMCAPRFQDKDIRCGDCPNHGGSTWHIVNMDGTSECLACGHAHPYEPGILERNRFTASGTQTTHSNTV